MYFEYIIDSTCLGKEPMEFRGFRAGKQRRNFVGQNLTVPPRRGASPQMWEKSFRDVERLRTVLPQKFFSKPKFKCFSASRTHPQILIFGLFLMFSYLNSFLNIMRSFLSQITILESIIQFKDQLSVKLRVKLREVHKVF